MLVENMFRKFREELLECCRKFCDCCSNTMGSQIVEFAVSLPLLAAVIIGITDFSSAFNLKFKLSNAAHEGARFASTQTTSDLTNAPPASITAIRDVVNSYLVGDRVNTCGLASATPTNSGLIWTYTANTGCPGTFTLTIDRGNTFVTGGVTVEATRVSVNYPFRWRFSKVIRVLIPGAVYAGVSYLSNSSVMQNLN
jgi:Flp pilus assembly protein TadG